MESINSYEELISLFLVQSFEEVDCNNCQYIHLLSFGQEIEFMEGEKMVDSHLYVNFFSSLCKFL